ncbi:MAG TPA: menaquinol-cytochrome C reductase, partial [Chloroflexi bacterium]|nr:menaquinol-cytochrome C reductase [Chloroflexota bacterium]
TAALVLIAAIPFVDRSPLGVGVLFTSDKGKKIVWFSAIFTVVVEFGLIMFDAYIGVTKSLQGKVPEIIYEKVIPVIVMIAFSLILVVLLQRIYRPTRRELIIGLFTGFVATYFFLTIMGTFFRGYGMALQLYWPWVDLQHAAHH